MNPMLANITPLERRYVKLYAQAVKKDFDLLITAEELMAAEGLGLSCPVHACRVAEKLMDFRARFIGSLTLFAHRHKLKRKPSPPSPTEEELTNLVVSSFFKVVAVVNSPYADSGIQKDAGWFSGDSNTWQKNLLALKTAWSAATKPEPFSGILAAFAQLFYLAAKHKFQFQHKQQFPAPNLEDEEWHEDEEDHAGPEEFD